MIAEARTVAGAPPQTAHRFEPARAFVALDRTRRLVSTQTGRIATRLANLVMAVYKGLWLGTLDRAQLAAVTQIAYEEACGGERWDAAEYLDSGLHNFERAFAERLPHAARILVACAGAGREAFALARDGFAVTAFDCAPSLVESARAHARASDLAVRFVQAAPDEVPALGTFDGAIVGWGGYIHIVGRNARIDFLRGIARQLAPGAPLLVSFLTRPERSRAFAISTAIAATIRRLRRAEPIECGDDITHVGTFAHCFTRAEIAGELESAGLRVDWFDAKDIRAVKDGYAVGVAGETEK
jgi:2-polyprenyl-3-methyl-5-hydroxy-6-metoxy-1,4-benzoquinol methylase